MQALEFFRVHHFQNADVQRLIGDDPIKPAVFILKPFYFCNIAHFQPAELRFPAIKRRGAHIVPSANLVGREAGLKFLKDADDFDFAESPFLHGVSSRPLASEFSTYFRSLFQATRHPERRRPPSAERTGRPTSRRRHPAEHVSLV